MSDEAMTGAEVHEMEALVDLKGSIGWKYFRNILSEHRIFCINKSHSCLQKFEDRKAGEWLAKANHISEIMTKLADRIKELKDKQNTIMNKVMEE